MISFESFGSTKSVNFMPDFKCIGCSVTFIHIILLMSSVCLNLCESFSSFSWVDTLSVIKLFLSLGLEKMMDVCGQKQSEAESNLMFLASAAEEYGF